MSGPGEPAFAGAGRFVRDPVPVTMYRSCCHFLDLTADTLRLDAGGVAHATRVVHDVFSPYDLTSAPYDSTRTEVWVGTWQASRAAVRVALGLGGSVDTLRLVARTDGGLQDTTRGAGYARR